MSRDSDELTIYLGAIELLGSGKYISPARAVFDAATAWHQTQLHVHGATNWNTTTPPADARDEDVPEYPRSVPDEDDAA